MAKHVLVSTLGNYTAYRTVHYRVYVEKSGNTRTPVVVATSYGPLAVLAANMVRGESDKPTSNDQDDFYMLVFAPITLATVVAKSSEDLLKILSNLPELASRLVEGLKARVNRSYEVATQYYKEKGETDAIIPRFLEVAGLSRPASPMMAEITSLPIVAEFEAHLAIRPAGSDEELRRRGTIGLALTPLTGTYVVRNWEGQERKNTTILFRESSSDYVEVFGDAMRALVLSVLYESYSEALKKLSGSTNGDETLKFLFDTTHGINNVVTVVTGVVTSTLELLRYEALSLGFRRFNVLFYNSDPFIPAGRVDDKEALDRTKSENVSYYFQRSGHLQPVSTIADRVDQLSVNLVGDDDKDFVKLLRGFYLLRRGVIPWGLYMIETSQFQSKVGGPETTIKIDVVHEKDASMSIKVNYKIPEPSKVERRYIVLLAEWLLKLVSRAVKRLIGKGDMLPAPELGKLCWGDIVRDTKCYSLKLMRLLAGTGGAQCDYDCQWALSLVRSILSDTARLIVEHEVEELRKDTINRLQYTAIRTLAPGSKRSDESDCGALLGGRGKTLGEKKYYCVTPMIEQEEVRNIIAHAGLTSATRFIGFIFSQDVTPANRHDENEHGRSKHRCTIVGVCIASDMPDEFFKKLKAELGSNTF